MGVKEASSSFHFGFWTRCLELPTTIPQKNSVLQLLKRNLRPIYFTFICAEVQVLVSVSLRRGACM